MAVIVGADGAVELDLGNGNKCVAEVFAWNASMKREMLRRTTQADEAERRTGGLSDWTGSFSFRLQFSDDDSIAQSAWQIAEFAVAGTDDELKAEASFVLQRYGVRGDCDIFQSTISDAIKLVGTIVIGDLSFDCSDPEQPLVCVASWEADGALALVREPVELDP